MKMICVIIATGGLALSTLAAETKSPEILFVSNERSGDISVIDPVSRSVIETFPVGKRPRGIHYSAAGGKLYVAVSGSPRMAPGADPERSHSAVADKSADGVIAISRSEPRKTKMLRVGSDPEQFALTRDGAGLVVSNEDDSKASYLDLAAGKVTRTFDVSDEPEGVAVNPANGEIYVTCEGDGAIYVFDATATKQVARFSVGGRPRNVTFTRDGQRAFIPAEGSASVFVVDAVAHHVLQPIPIPGERVLPMDAVLVPDEKRLLVTTGRANRVAVIDLTTNQVERMITVGERPWGIEIDASGKFAYTANGGSDDVSVIDLSNFTEVARIKVGKGPWGICRGR